MEVSEEELNFLCFEYFAAVGGGRRGAGLNFGGIVGMHIYIIEI